MCMLEWVGGWIEKRRKRERSSKSITISEATPRESVQHADLCFSFFFLFLFPLSAPCVQVPPTPWASELLDLNQKRRSSSQYLNNYLLLLLLLFLIASCIHAPFSQLPVFPTTPLSVYPSFSFSCPLPTEHPLLSSSSFLLLLQKRSVEEGLDQLLHG